MLKFSPMIVAATYWFIGEVFPQECLLLTFCFATEFVASNVLLLHVGLLLNVWWRIYGGIYCLLLKFCLGILWLYEILFANPCQFNSFTFLHLIKAMSILYEILFGNPCQFCLAIHVNPLTVRTVGNSSILKQIRTYMHLYFLNFETNKLLEILWYTPFSNIDNSFYFGPPFFF